ncbi:MAG TPA: L-lactate dehydrogenase [Enhygromyxa sp.]|nr:L-lactate dehydrogenase [Enhygromyxa sp.]
MKIGIIGMGWVGTSIAASILRRGVANELWLNDIRPEIAEGEAMDLAHGSSFYPPAVVRAVELDEMCRADAVVIAAGRGGGPGQSRLELLNENATIVAKIAESLRGLAGLLIVVTNPVDIMTRVAVAASGLDRTRVIGTGTMLDTARLRYAVGRELQLDARSIHAQVIGEHGDSEVVLWSSATVGGVRLRDWRGWGERREAEIAEEVRCAAYEIIKRKGATNHAIGLVTAALLQWTLGPEHRVLTLSSVQDERFDGVAFSLPTIVGPHGIVEVLTPEMSASERAGLQRSVEVLGEAYDSMVW